MIAPIQILAELLEDLTAQIRAAGKEDDYCSLTVQPGNAVSFDFGPESGCGGIAWTRLVASSPAVGSNGCAVWLVHTIEVGIVGPVPGLEYTLGEYTVPSDAELFDAAARQSDELVMMWQALKGSKVEGLTIGDYSPSGPEGGIMGGYFTVTVEPD